MYLRVNLTSFVKKQAPAAPVSLVLATVEESDEYLFGEDLEIYYSFTHELPNRFVNDGEGFYNKTGNYYEMIAINNVSDQSKILIFLTYSCSLFLH